MSPEDKRQREDEVTEFIDTHVEFQDQARRLYRVTMNRDAQWPPKGYPMWRSLADCDRLGLPLSESKWVYPQPLDIPPAALRRNLHAHFQERVKCAMRREKRRTTVDTL
jgi:hypothetical protein